MLCKATTTLGSKCQRICLSNYYCWQHAGASKSIRPSPSDSATLYPVGKTKKGNDGNMWVITITQSGIKRWSRISKNKSINKSINKSNNSYKTRLLNLVNQIIQKGSMWSWIYDDKYNHKLSLDVEQFVLQIVKKIAKDYKIDVSQIKKLEDVFTTNIKTKHDTAPLVKILGPPEFRVNLARNSDGFLLDVFLVPGENEHGYMVYYDIPSKKSYYVAKNWDGDNIPLGGFSFLKNFLSWRNDAKLKGIF